MDQAGEYYGQLNELSRLYIRRSDYARAEPVLERLLQIARAKGDNHPDVATALAGLAVAKRGLGDHAAAEQLYRDALRIREEVLAPHHMAIVVTLEQLAETCADRGKVAEALVHLQRALLRRERALGAEHASALALRARMIDLERRGYEQTPPKRPGELAFLFQSESAGPRAALPAIEPEPAPLPSLAAASSIVDAADAPEPTRTTALALTAPPARVWSRRRTTRLASAAAVVVLAIAGFGFSSTRRSETEDASVPPGAEPRHVVVTPGSNAGSLAAVGAPAPEAASSRSHAIPMPKDTQPAAEEEHATTSNVSVALPNLRRLVVPRLSTPSVDSLVRDAVKPGQDSDSEQIGAKGGLLAPAQHDDATVTPPVLITAPTLRFPDELRAHRVEGEVVVQLRVNEKGRVDPSSMRVMHSEHELFTAVVRSALPRFRFEPARSAAPESKPQSAWVQFRAEFTARN